MLATVHIIAEEEVVRLWREPSVFKESKEVGVLAVYVTADFDGSFQLQEHRLLHKNLSGDLAEHRDVLLLDLDVFAAPLQQLVDN